MAARVDVASPEQLPVVHEPRLRIAAGLLVAGWAAFWAGAVTPWAAQFFMRPLAVRELLAAVHAARFEWLFIAGSFALGVVLTLLGLVALRVVLRENGDPGWSELGQAAFSLGAALWIAAIAFRATAVVSAAEEAATRGAVPSWFEPMRAWAGALFAVYMVLAYLAIAAYGQALRATRFVPRGWAIAHLVFGLAGAAGFVARVPVFFPPLLIHLLPGLLGVYLLATGRRTRPGSAP